MKEDNGEKRAYAPWYGRGVLQLTHYYNYGDYDHINAADNPDIILELPYCVSSGFWVYCIQLNLVEYAKRDDFNYLVAKINGGFNGYIDRLNYFNHIVSILKADHLRQSETHNEFFFKESEIYQYRLYSLLWGKWHDPNLHQYSGTEKNVGKALDGYYRAKELYEHRHDKDKIHEIKERIKKLF